MGGFKWTPEQLEQLEQWYGDLRVETIARRLGRTVNAVHVQAQKLHLGRNRPSDVLSMNELMGILGVETHGIVRRWIREGWLPAVRRPMYGRQSRAEWWIRQADLERFLREHGHQVDRDRIQPPFQRHVPERWITFVEAFRRGAAWPFFLEAAVKSGLLPEARKRGEVGTRWVIPERLLPELLAARRRMTTDAEHRRLVLMYNHEQGRGNVKRKISQMNARARAAADGGISGRNRQAVA